MRCPGQLTRDRVLAVAQTDWPERAGCRLRACTVFPADGRRNAPCCDELEVNRARPIRSADAAGREHRAKCDRNCKINAKIVSIAALTCWVPA